MTQPTLSMIAAIGRNRELGKDNKLPWSVPEDSARFRLKVEGHVAIFGRKTFEAGGGVLKTWRTNIIVTRDPNFKLEGAEVCHSIEEAIELAKKITTLDEIFILGGGQIYQQALKYADKLYLTIIDADFEADTYFPDYSEFNKVVFEQKGNSGGFDYTFIDLVRG